MAHRVMDRSAKPNGDAGGRPWLTGRQRLDQVPNTWNSQRLYPYPVARAVPYIRM